MANLKEIRRRISSVKGTQKITRAMKMVAAAKLRKAQEAAEKFRAYADLTTSVLAEVAQGASEDDHPLLARRENIDSSVILVVSADRGLCGGFNSNLNRLVFEETKKQTPAPHLAIMGKKAEQFFDLRPVDIADRFSKVRDDPNYEAVAAVARKLAGKYQAGEIDQIDIAFTQMITRAAQEPIIKPLLPVALPQKNAETEQDAGPSDFIFEPERKALLGRLLPNYIEVEIYRAVLESIAAEHAARMGAMEMATDNAQEMIDRLTLTYNRARQSAITSELMDIVGGAEALD